MSGGRVSNQFGTGCCSARRHRRLRVLARHLESPAACGFGEKLPCAELTGSGSGLLNKPVESHYDFIVVGAGSAGCVVASRLSEDPSVSVLLIEAGPSNQTFMVRSPLLTCPHLQNTERDWAFRTEPQPGTDGRVSFWPRGKTLGGSSSINYMLYVRGDPRNYDHWARDLGCDGWSYKDVLPFFKKSEDFVGTKTGSESYHGQGGMLKVTHMRDGFFATKDISERFVAACRHQGISDNDDYNGPTQDGASLSQVTVKNGTRCDTASAFLFQSRALERPNLTVVTGWRATKLLSQGTMITGVEMQQDDLLHAQVTGPTAAPQLSTVCARKEVVLSAGSVCTPWLLQLSGIGAATSLSKFDIPVVADLPGVGQNLQDHLFLGMHFGMKPGCSNGFCDQSKLDIAKTLAQYMIGRGLGCFPSVHALAFFSSGLSPPEQGNDLQLHLVPFISHDQQQIETNFGIVQSEARPGKDTSNTPHGIIILPSLVLPQSRGSVLLRSASPAIYPVIQPQYYTDPRDMDIVMKGCKFVRKVVASKPLSEVLGAEIPDPSIPQPLESDAYLRELISRDSITIYHPVGTAKMGSPSDPMAVVDTRLRVLKVRGLRVVDASIMPRVISGNTNAPTIMIGERAAHMIKEDWGLMVN